MSDVVSRLLAAIDEREAKANRLAGEDWFAVPEVYLSEAYAQHAAMHGPKSVLRLCQAHRDIVAKYQEAEAARGKTGPSPMSDLDHASAMGRLTALGLVVQALARGYKEARDDD